MREQRLSVPQQKVMAGIELVRLRQSEIRSQQIGHGALAEPFAMELPFAARRSEKFDLDQLQLVLEDEEQGAAEGEAAEEAAEPSNKRRRTQVANRNRGALPHTCRASR
jgi:hypothetical protein